MPVTFIIFFICMLAETNRAPFDMAEAESELVAGAFTEYAGMGFGVFFMAEYANILVGCSLATILFFGGWQSPIGVLSGVWWFLLKLYLLIFRPISKGYEKVVPKTARKGIDNAYDNIKFPVRLVNHALQGKFKRVGRETEKFLLNTVVGVGGLIRVSDKVPALAELPHYWAC